MPILEALKNASENRLGWALDSAKVGLRNYKKDDLALALQQADSEPTALLSIMCPIRGQALMSPDPRSPYCSSPTLWSDHIPLHADQPPGPAPFTGRGMKLLVGVKEDPLRSIGKYARDGNVVLRFRIRSARALSNQVG